METHSFEQLLPDFIIDAVESTGLSPDGRILALNSYENRVYQVGMNDGQVLIAKFYRPYRWSDEQILEEHQFCQALVEHELPVLAPISSDAILRLAGDCSQSGQEEEAKTLFYFENMRFSLYERRGGRAPELENEGHLKQVSRTIARIHAVGAESPYRYRPTLDIQTYVKDSIELISEQFIPPELKTPYLTLVRDLLQHIEDRFNQVGQVSLIRTHTDCHLGNMLCRDDQIHFIDFDDSRMAPAVQDLWMLLSGDRQQRLVQLDTILEAYREFYEFDSRELQLIEALQTMRVIQYSAWLAKRWSDPAFPHNFPWFNTQRYWSDHILTLREQLSELIEPSLASAC